MTDREQKQKLDRLARIGVEMDELAEQQRLLAEEEQAIVKSLGGRAVGGASRSAETTGAKKWLVDLAGTAVQRVLSDPDQLQSLVATGVRALAPTAAAQNKTPTPQPSAGNILGVNFPTEGLERLLDALLSGDDGV